MHDQKAEMFSIAEKLGVSIDAGEGEIKYLSLNKLKIVDLLPEMLIMIRSSISNKTFSYKRKQIKVMDKGLVISFQNLLNVDDDNNSSAFSIDSGPHVRITPSHLESEVLFTRDTHLQQVTILVELEYLKRFAGIDQNKLYYLFDAEKTFWIEEFLSPDMLVVLSQLDELSSDSLLSQANYRIKALELIYLLFLNLLRRECKEHKELSRDEINAVYLARNYIATTLDKAPSKMELIRLSGMNELKFRRVFRQVFGRGVYEYYNYLRMQEAGKILKQNNFSVSEVGYKLGFSNLSYFGRMFEKHFGLKPKKWQYQNTKR